MKLSVRIDRAITLCLVMVGAFGLLSPAAAADAELSLEFALQRAGRHPDVVAAEQELIRAERELASRQRAFTPQASIDVTPLGMSLRGEAWRRDDPAISLSASQQGTSGMQASVSVGASVRGDGVDVPSWSLSLSHPLLRTASLSSTHQAVRQAEAEVEVARSQLQRAELQAQIDIVRLYGAALVAAEAWAQAGEAYREAQENHVATLRRRELGVAGEIEQLEADVSLRREELAMVQAERTYAERLRGLVSALDLPYAEYRLRPLPRHLAAPDLEVDLAALEEAALATDPGLRQRRLAVAAAENQLRAAEEQLRLEGSIRAGVSKARDTGETTWSVQLQFGYPLLDGGAAKAAVEDKERALDAAREAYVAAKDQVLREVRGYVDAVFDASVQAEIAALSLQMAEMELRQATAAHALGVLGDAEMRQAERAWQRAQGEHAAAVLQQWLALWDAYAFASLQPRLPAALLQETVATSAMQKEQEARSKEWVTE